MDFPPPILTHAEVEALLAYPDGRPRVHRSTRERRLREMGLKYKVVGLGEIIIGRAHFLAVMSEKPELELAVDNTGPQEYEVNIEALRRLSRHGTTSTQR